jgi:hypothetical protein
MSRERFEVLIFILLTLIAAACGDDGTSSTVEPARPAAAQTSLPPTSSSSVSNPESVGPSDEFVPDYAALIATVESAVEGTSYEGAALEDPEVFIATAELFCDLLDEGMTREELLTEYLDRLSDGGAVEVDDDDGLMAGALLGASIEIVCPETPDEGT